MAGSVGSDCRGYQFGQRRTVSTRVRRGNHTELTGSYEFSVVRWTTPPQRGGTAASLLCLDQRLKIERELHNEFGSAHESARCKKTGFDNFGAGTRTPADPRSGGADYLRRQCSAYGHV